MRPAIDAARGAASAHRARGAAAREACGPAEPHHAASVNGRTAEPKNSVGGPAWLRGAMPAHGPDQTGRDADVAMAESGTRGALLKKYRRAAYSAGEDAHSTTGRDNTERTHPATLALSALVPRGSGNHRSRSSCHLGRENWLKSSPSSPTFIHDRVVARKSSVSTAPDFTNLHTLARCPNGLSGAVRRTDPSPQAPL